MEFTICSKKHGTHTVYVDDEDYSVIAGYTWCLTGSQTIRSLYAQAYSHYENGKQKTVYMHKLITGFNQTDHINRNGLDNRRENLREANSSQNHGNVSLQRNNTSGFKGVCWNKYHRKWTARIMVKRSYIFLGHFDCPVEAAIAYNDSALKYFGEFAYLNPIPEDTYGSRDI